MEIYPTWCVHGVFSSQPPATMGRARVALMVGSGLRSIVLNGRVGGLLVDWLTVAIRRGIGESLAGQHNISIFIKFAGHWIHQRPTPKVTQGTGNTHHRLVGVSPGKKKKKTHSAHDNQPA